MSNNAEEIRPTALTLRFKHGKHTILLFTEPLTPFPAIKTELLSILHERYPNGLLSSTPMSSPTAIPKDILGIILGVPIDVYEPSKGWTELSTSGGGVTETPKSLGLKDGGVLAFTFEQPDGDHEFLVEWSSYDEQYGDGEEGMEDVESG